MPEIAFPNLGITIETLSNKAFTIFSFPIYWYGIMLGLGVLGGLMYATHEAKRTGQNPELYYDLLLYLIVACVIGARAYYVAFSWDMYKDNLLEIFNTRSGGLALYGIVIAGLLTTFVYAKVKKMNLGLLIDTMAPGLVLGQAIGRWGNFFNREIFGGYTESLFAMRLLASTVNDIPPSVAEKMLEIDGASYIQVHPTFLYESFLCLVTFLLLNLLKRHKKFNGELIFMYFIMYGIIRFIMEGIRTDYLLLWDTNIRVSQLLSAVLVFCGVSVIAYFRFFKRSKNIPNI